MSLSRTRQGDLLVLIQAVLYASFPIAAVASYKTITPFHSLFYSSVFTAGLFFLLFCFRPKWREFLIPGVFKELLLVSLFIGVGFYGLFFLALKYTTAGNASLIALMEIFYNYLFFHVWKKEHLDKGHITGGLLMLLGVVMVLFNEVSTPKIGDIIILFAAMLPPLGNYYQQKLRKKVSTQTVLFGRSILTLPFLALFVPIFGESLAPSVDKGVWIFLLLNGVVFLGISKIFWLEGIHRISVTKASILGSISPAFTLLLAAFFLKQPPNFWQILAFLPLGIGLWFLTSKKTIDEAEMESI